MNSHYHVRNPEFYQEKKSTRNQRRSSVLLSYSACQSADGMVSLSCLLIAYCEDICCSSKAKSGLLFSMATISWPLQQKHARERWPDPKLKKLQQRQQPRERKKGFQNWRRLGERNGFLLLQNICRLAFLQLLLLLWYRTTSSVRNNP